MNKLTLAELKYSLIFCGFAARDLKFFKAIHGEKQPWTRNSRNRLRAPFCLYALTTANLKIRIILLYLSTFLE